MHCWRGMSVGPHSHLLQNAAISRLDNGRGRFVHAGGEAHATDSTSATADACSAERWVVTRCIVL